MGALLKPYSPDVCSGRSQAGTFATIALSTCLARASCTKLDTLTGDCSMPVKFVCVSALYEAPNENSLMAESPSVSTVPAVGHRASSTAVATCYCSFLGLEKVSARPNLRQARVYHTAQDKGPTQYALRKVASGHTKTICWPSPILKCSMCSVLIVHFCRCLRCL